MKQYHMRLMLAGLPIALLGCQTIDNDRLTVGGESVPAIQSELDRQQYLLHQAAGPSLMGVDRSHWSHEAVMVGTDGVQHHTRGTTNQPAYVKTTRAGGEFPNTETALALGSPAGPQVAEAWAGPFHAAMDVILAIPRKFVHHPGSVVVSPTEPYERGPAVDGPAAVPQEAAPVESATP